MNISKVQESQIFDFKSNEEKFLFSTSNALEQIIDDIGSNNKLLDFELSSQEHLSELQESQKEES